jgi:polyhydroxyalkanoate synthase
MAKTKISVDLILSKLAEHTEETKTKAQKASDVLLSPLETDLAMTPYDVVYQEDRVKLKHYKPTEEGLKTRLKTPLLIVYALINRETMLDLQPGRSVVQSFQNLGVDVYMIDWGYPSRKDQFLTIDDHVNGYIHNVVDYICKRHNIPQLNLMGVCMGGAFSVMFSALHPEKVKNLVTTVTPTNFDTDQGLLHIWLRNVNVDRMVDTYGNMPGDLLNFGFLLLNPARLMIDKYVGFMENMDNKNFVENFVRMERWIFDSPDVPGATFRQFMVDCYQKNLLIQSKLELNGKRVDLKKITMPLLNIYGLYDHLVPPEACELLTSNVGSKDATDVSLKTGHIGIYVSSKVQKEFAPNIVRWLTEREAPPKKTARKKAASAPKTRAASAPKTRTTPKAKTTSKTKTTKKPANKVAN